MRYGRNPPLPLPGGDGKYIPTMNFTETYQHKKVFITGHTGFKGSWLLAWLQVLGAQVKGYALAPQPEHQLYQHIDGNARCESEIGDIMHYEQLEKSILDFQPGFCVSPGSTSHCTAIVP